ncbi:2OG-Fe(II) oxygenase [Aurantiacibacter poecillastricola]|uniref:2OG-Fe(II) oxygenase n=1 Tax=Aurantiacibacter poecillastricola TaxID=3064385 RepID=UPI00273D444F|nr:2OG-Fe(II) oxygenase [Aurantiacibacter sp. 219JJ12-13]MDP5260714.1 2OG-Fe(II) oxygenase [Aurantiacibacter sp. 219JJ12-13]
MAVLELTGSPTSPRFDEAQCVAAGERLAAEYQNASPFPHIAIDDFIAPDALRPIIANFPPREKAVSFSRDQEKLKYQFHPDSLEDDLTYNLFTALNSQPFLRFLTALTGIEGLIADPYFAGGGLHETLRGGHLGVHADFNRHKKMNVRRRINVLIYLNEDWKDEYGGHLELWSKDMKTVERSVAPILGRSVIFNTDLDSYHGHPDPLTTPDGISRRSIATYYYTSAQSLADQPDRTTNFKRRPQSNDKEDFSVKARELVRDLAPPALLRAVRRLK